MKRLAMFGAAIGGALLVGSAPARAQSTEEAAVREALGHYLMAHATGDGNHHKLVFHPDAKLFFNRDGKLTTLTSAEYISRSSGKPQADEAQRKRWVDHVDVTGDVATARIILDYPQAKLTDYMSLLKIDGKWMIVNKVFTSEPKKP